MIISKEMLPFAFICSPVPSECSSSMPAPGGNLRAMAMRIWRRLLQNLFEPVTRDIPLNSCVGLELAP
jgi:hypothetical protein